MVAETTKGPVDFFTGLVEEHGRIEAQLASLLQAADALSKDESSSAEREAITRTLRFFTNEGARHEEREERLLFARLRHRPEFRQILGALEFQHGMNRRAGQELAACLEHFGAGQGRELRRLAIRFVEMHRGHAVAEERALFPLAAAVLSPQEVAEMVRER